MNVQPRSKLIERSLSCFNWGLASLVPILGIFSAFMALLRFRFVIMESDERWNPARLRLYGGMALALMSLLGHALIGVFIYVKVVRDLSNA